MLRILGANDIDVTFPPYALYTTISMGLNLVKQSTDLASVT